MDRALRRELATKGCEARIAVVLLGDLSCRRLAA